MTLGDEYPVTESLEMDAVEDMHHECYWFVTRQILNAALEDGCLFSAVACDGRG